MCLLLTDLACVQSLTSRALGADLHPAARFGQGVFIAHPLGAPSLVSGCQLDRVFNCWLANCLWIINLIKDEHAWVCLAKPSVYTCVQSSQVMTLSIGMTCMQALLLERQREWGTMSPSCSM